MPSTTPKGFPFPVGTDRVMDGDDAIQALAEFIDARVGVFASGVATVNFANTGQVVQAVTFPAGRFNSPPNVVFAFFIAQGGVTTQTVRQTSAPSTTGFSLVVNAPGATTFTYTVTWLAHQP